MIIIIELGMQHVHSLLLCIDIFLKAKGNISHSSQLCVLGSLHLFLFGNKALLILDVLPMIHIRHVLLCARMTQVC